MGPAGVQDPDPHPDHIATYQGLKDAGYARTSWQKIYQYQELKTPDGVLKLTDDECEQKHKALLEYRKWDPENGRYAFGWLHSAGYLFERASRSCLEYLVTSDAAFIAYPTKRPSPPPTKSPLSIDPGTLQIKTKKSVIPPPQSQPGR
jgi:hypothetical protein